MQKTKRSKPEFQYKIIKNAKEGRSYRYTNTYILSSYDLFCEGPETKYGIETRCVLINKKRKHI